MNIDRARIHDRAFLSDPTFAGAQIKYTWRELEPEKDRYEFSRIREDLAALSSHGKKLFIQLQDVSFYESIVNVPQYLRDDPAYHGGAHLEILDQARGTRGGWIPRRWDPAVRHRFHKLLTALGREFDGKIEGINLAETSIEIQSRCSRRDHALHKTIHPRRPRSLSQLRGFRRGAPCVWITPQFWEVVQW